MKKYALVLCATLWLLGVGGVATAQAAKAASAGTVPALGNAQAVDETTLSLGTQGGSQTQPGASAGSDTTAYFLRMIIVLALILGVIYVIFRLMKKSQKPRMEVDSSIKVLATASLGQGRAVHLVGIGGKAWLLGSAEQSVSLIAEVEDRELLDGLELKAATETVRPRADFSSLLSGFLGKGARLQNRGGKKATPGDFGAEYLAQQRDRLKKY